MECPLCQTTASMHMPGDHVFLDCPTCRGIFRPRGFLPDPDFEKHRYELHENNPEDSGYRSFVMPLCDAVSNAFASAAGGLDFGAGTNSAVAAILRERGFDVVEFDPFFTPEVTALKKNYDFIACCEVMEHFHNPKKEFTMLSQMLNPGGKLFCMTHLYDETPDFASWYYKNDPTHVFIYRRETVSYIARTFNFSEYGIDGRLIVFSH